MDSPTTPDRCITLTAIDAVIIITVTCFNQRRRCCCCCFYTVVSTVVDSGCIMMLRRDEDFEHVTLADSDTELESGQLAEFEKV